MASCSSGWKTVQRKLNTKLAEYHQPKLDVDGLRCCGLGSKSKKPTGYTYNALVWWLGGWNIPKTPAAALLAIDERSDPMLIEVPDPVHVGLIQQALKLPVDYCLGSATASALTSFIGT